MPVLRGEVEPVETGNGNLNPIDTDDARRARRTLILMGVVSAGLYTLLAVRYPLGPSLENPRASWVNLVGQTTWLGLGFHLAVYLALTLLYIRALRHLHERSAQPADRWIRRIILLTWLACSLILLAVGPGGESHDIFDYLFRGRMMAELGANPLVDTPLEFRRAAFFRYVAWHSHVDTYGPLWEMVSAATGTLVREGLQAVGWWGSQQISCPQSAQACRNLVVYLTAYRLVAIGLTAISAALIASLVRRSRPALANLALAAWLWSPVLIISTAVGGHNDALMIVLLLATLWLLQRQHWLLALLTLALAAHVKLVALLVLPAVGLWLVRRLGWRRALIFGILGAAGAALLSWLLYLPFGGWDSLPRMLHERGLFLANSPWRVLHSFLIYDRGWTAADARPLTARLPNLLFLVAAVLIALWMLDFRPRRWKSAPAPDWSDDRLLWRTIVAVFMLYLVVGAFWFQHWYVLWVLVPAALLPDTTLTRRLLPWLGFGALSANVVGDFALAPLPKGQSKTGVHALIVAMIWGPFLLALSGVLRKRGRRL
ncbi:MAG: DUF2029 domain-containing protein [Caldilineales bacterium]|nr:DUF2029 domain-containing protein [Caldilineales bacterium]